MPNGSSPVKVLDLKVRLSSLWKFASAWNIVSLGRGFYEFSFESLEDLYRVRSTATWNLRPGLLKTFAWKQDFNPLNVQITTAPCWVRLYGLPQEYWDSRLLFQIAQGLGTPISLDSITSTAFELRHYAHYARMLVDVDLKTDLWYRLLVERDSFEFFIDVEYENLPSFCSHCHTIGHMLQDCVHGIQESVPVRKTHKGGTGPDAKTSGPGKQVYVPKPVAQLHEESSDTNIRKLQNTAVRINPLSVHASISSLIRQVSKDSDGLDFHVQGNVDGNGNKLVSDIPESAIINAAPVAQNLERVPGSNEKVTFELGISEETALNLVPGIVSTTIDPVIEKQATIVRHNGQVQNVDNRTQSRSAHNTLGRDVYGFAQGEELAGLRVTGSNPASNAMSSLIFSLDDDDQITPKGKDIPTGSESGMEAVSTPVLVGNSVSGLFKSVGHVVQSGNTVRTDNNAELVTATEPVQLPDTCSKSDNKDSVVFPKDPSPLIRSKSVPDMAALARRLQVLQQQAGFTSNDPSPVQVVNDISSLPSIVQLEVAAFEAKTSEGSGQADSSSGEGISTSSNDTNKRVQYSSLGKKTASRQRKLRKKIAK